MRTTSAIFGAVFWIRLILAAIWVGVPLLLGVALVWWTTRRRDHVRQTRVTRLTGLGVGALVGVGLVWAAQLWLAPIAVVAGYLVGVFSGAQRDSPAPSGSVRVASLRPRTVGGYVPRWAVVVAVVAAAITLLAPVILTAVPTATYGPWHPFPGRPQLTLPGATLRWPSAIEWLPLGVVAVGAVLVGRQLIQRVLRLPVDPSGQRESSLRNTVRTITGTVVGIELVALGALSIGTSSGLAVPAQIGGVAYLGSRILVWTGLGLAAAGIVVWCALSTWRRGPRVPDTVPEA